MKFPNCPRCGAEESSQDGFTPCKECQEEEERNRREYEFTRVQLQIGISETEPEGSSK